MKKFVSRNDKAGDGGADGALGSIIKLKTLELKIDVMLDTRVSKDILFETLVH